MSETITRLALQQLVDAWIAQGKHVAGPTLAKDDLYLYAPIFVSTDLAFDGFIRPVNSIKEFFFPRHEKIYRYYFKGHAIELENVDPAKAEQVIVGARPCDAAMLPVLDKVFNWDYKDEFYCSRRDVTTVITIGCTAWDDECFCTSVGLGPQAEKGSDVLLLPMADGTYEVRCLTEKGKALFAGKTQSSSETAAPVGGPEKKVDVDAVTAFLKENYESDLWKQIALRCLGCGACAYTCPTCHCFDIVDEGNAHEGCRAKNWDSCQFSMFTMHASGHNPRANQAVRQRQRIQHKFRIYPEKFDEILCTGCGNCTRNCPVALGVLGALGEISSAL